MNQGLPSKQELLEAYQRLCSNHPRALLPLETKLPDELQAHARDQYRIIMTMILSERTDDYKLSRALSRLFRKYPDFKDLRDLSSKQQIIERILAGADKGGCGFGGYNKPNGGGNDDRLWTFLNHYFGHWNLRITEQNIMSLEEVGQEPSGFGPKFVRTLLAYCPLDGSEIADTNVLPLDGKALDALHTKGFYKHDKNGDTAREDIESKLKSEIPLIDFHELLRFDGQTCKLGPGGVRKIIIGWNAWRLLCSSKRVAITGEDWIYEHLVKDKSIAKKLWLFLSENQ